MNRKSISLIVLILILGCSSRNQRGIEFESNGSEKDYYSYPINITLKENRELLKRIDNYEINQSEYDSLLILNGRKPWADLIFDRLLCDNKSQKVYTHLVRAEYFIQKDSLVFIADKNIENILISNPTNASANLLLGISKYIQEEFEESLFYLENAKQYSSHYDNSLIYLNLGNSKWGNDQKKDAINDYEIAFNKNPKFIPDNWGYLFQLYINTGNFGKANEFLFQVENDYGYERFRYLNWRKYVDTYWGLGEFKSIKKICYEVRDSVNFHGVTETLMLASALDKDYNSTIEYLWALSDLELSTISRSSNFVFPYYYPDIEPQYLPFKKSLETEVNFNPSSLTASYCLGFIYIAEEMHKYNSDERDMIKIEQGLSLVKGSYDQNDARTSFLLGAVSQEIGDYTNAYQYYDRIPES